jgi:methyl-accepting chemotaxis protein
MDLTGIGKIINETSKNLQSLMKQSDVIISEVKSNNPEMSENFKKVFEDFEELKKSIKKGSSSKVDEIISKYGDKINK